MKNVFKWKKSHPGIKVQQIKHFLLLLFIPSVFRHLMLMIDGPYPIALLCEMSRSIGMGDTTVLKEKRQK